MEFQLLGISIILFGIGVALFDQWGASGQQAALSIMIFGLIFSILSFANQYKKRKDENNDK